MNEIDDKVIVVNYRYDDRTNERVVDPSNRELDAIGDWAQGDEELRAIMSEAGLVEIAISCETWGLTDLFDWSPKHE